MTLFVAAEIILITAALFIVWSKISNRPKPVFCTQEAKLCPDGSYVGRTGPACGFASCPGGNNDLWKTMTDGKTGVTFKYPEKLQTDYIFAQSWPPIVTASDKKTNSLVR